ncbi:BON domain-containing protein [Aquabacterium sp. A7-Y]|uniref:BON domain-containing protein n=1 Tax=Aquabacterium sp. A7-Y TaxID=1349605 RepID=UPI00223CE034|nr:BON domain-containing protein [Aquabacterium sp. A7-Y]MCW7539401.1 BON domain-containing protein [Aquabacterium sp. A7-Y]
MKALTLASALAAALSLVACDRADNDTTAERAGDEMVAQTDRAAQNVESGAERGADRAREAGSEIAEQARETGADIKGAAATGVDKAKDAGGEMADRAGEAVSDAAITASVNAELARDDKLSALRIDVDTSNGKVTLNGTAPSEADRERATQLASTVRGVTSVDNMLTVKPSENARPAK